VKLYFTRHGESQANRLGIISNRNLPHPLTETGSLQAAALAEKLRGLPLTRIYASPILRACQTGEILSAALSLPLELVDALREPDTGVWEGRGDAQAWTVIDHWVETWLSGRDLDRGPQGGETYIGIRERMAAFIGGLVKKYSRSADEFVIVSHGAAMLFGLPDVVEGLDAQDMRQYPLEYTGLLIVECRRGKLFLLKRQV
jgi:broad specificity phosphatase PhoE